MKVSRVLASYTTAYSGTFDRIQNLQRATQILDGTTLGPGATFSFNDVVGPRTTQRGFRSAPTIMNNEYEDHVGGGVSQVATTIFNAAWEAGLKITERTAHSLYISRYPLGRDATVNFPDVDLKFENDTKNWLYMQGVVGDTGITISCSARRRTGASSAFPGRSRTRASRRSSGRPTRRSSSASRSSRTSESPRARSRSSARCTWATRCSTTSPGRRATRSRAEDRPRRDDPGRGRAAGATREPAGTARTAASARHDHRARRRRTPAR